jgi:hypothetical protein
LCTLTWTRRGDGYELFFNRDELKTRQPAHPPELRRSNGVAYLAPIDADAGGTWLGVNELGLSVGLLNGWRPRDLREGDFTSRGHLVAGLLDARTAAEVAERVRARELTEFRSFTLFAVQPDQPVLRAAWSGEGLELAWLADTDQPISSSSRDPEGAARNRRRIFAGLAAGELPEPAQLAEFHRGHDPDPSAVSTCMHREDAETVSHTHVLVDASRVELRYHAGAPCHAAALHALDLPRASLSDSRPGPATPLGRCQ